MENETKIENGVTEKVALEKQIDKLCCAAELYLGKPKGKRLVRELRALVAKCDKNAWPSCPIVKK